jgi:hypothetical protein
MFMTGQGVVLEDQFHILRVLLEQLLEERIDPRTGGSLKIAILVDRNQVRVEIVIWSAAPTRSF